MGLEWQNREFVEWYNKNLEFDSEKIKAYLELLEPETEDILADFGCGNGVLLKGASLLMKKVVGIDESPAQLQKAEELLKDRPNVELLLGGFLDVSLKGMTFTKGSARKSLHHLTDEDKFLFFQRISPCFQPGSLFLIEDAVFSFPKEQLENRRKQLYDEAAVFYGDKWESIREAFSHTIFEEQPTDIFTWRKALEKGGFKVLNNWQKSCFYGIILSRKEI